MKILVCDGVEQSCIDILRREGFGVDERPKISAAELLAAVPAYEGVIVRSASKVTAGVIAAGARLKVVGRAGTGVDNIDVDAATRRGILVMNTPGGNTVSAAEHTVSLLLALARNIPQAYLSLSKGEWERKKFTGTEVLEKTIGVIGLGKIGREVAQRCQGLGMKTIGFDPVLSAEAAGKLGIELMNLEQLFRRSDFISVHTPLTDETRHLLNDETIARCKKGVRLINCARGGIIDEAALLRALNSGQVGGAALDVFESEPPAGNPLLSHPRVVATPHLGASTEEAQEKVAIQIAHGVVDALFGRSFTGVVNGAAMHLTLNQEVRPFVVLAERVGSLAAQLSSGKLKSITMGATGEIVISSFELLKAGALKGILSHTVPEPVNFISAPFLASEMGITVNETRDAAGESFSNLFRIRYETEREIREIAGTVIGTSTPRLVMLDGFRFEVRPEGYLLVYNNIDRPGILARIGGILAKYNVNIAGVSLGRSRAGGNALTVMNIDSTIPGEGMKELIAQDGVSNLRLARLD